MLTGMANYLTRWCIQLLCPKKLINYIRWKMNQIVSTRVSNRIDKWRLSWSTASTTSCYTCAYTLRLWINATNLKLTQVSEWWMITEHINQYVLSLSGGAANGAVARRQVTHWLGYITEISTYTCTCTSHDYCMAVSYCIVRCDKPQRRHRYIMHDVVCMYCAYVTMLSVDFHYFMNM